MLVIHAGNGKLIAIDRLKVINAKFNVGKELCHGFLYRAFLLYRFLRLLGILVILSCTGNELLEYAILQFKFLLLSFFDISMFHLQFILGF